MSWATGRGALPTLRGGEPATAMPPPCVGPGRSWRGIQRPWGRRWAAGASGGLGARRPSRSTVWETRCVSTERLHECRRPWGRRQAAETAEAKEALGTPRTAGSVGALRFPGAVWVNGAVGEPEVVGPAGSVWVTGTREEKTDYGGPRDCEGKGRPGSLGHESILELWLKVQAMRAASGCGEGSRIELYAMPAGEGPVERGIPGRASWVETNRGGLTGPWMKGQARAVPQATRVATAMALGADPERASGLYGQEPPVRLPPVVGFPGTLETSSGIAPCLWWREQAVELPRTVEDIGYGVSPGSWGKGQTMGMPPAMGWPEAVGVPRAVEGERGCGGAPCLSGRGQSVQGPRALAKEAVCGDTPGLRARGQAVGVPRAVEEEKSSAGALGLWQRRQVVEEIGSGGIPGLWGAGQPVGVPCAIEEQTTCGGDLGCRERGQTVWVETGSGDDPGSWCAAQTAEVSGPDEQEIGSGGAPGLWGIEQAMGVPRALEEGTGYRSLPDLWGTEQPVWVSQALVVPGAMGEETCYGGALGLWDRQQALGVPAADAAPDVAGEETCCGSVQSLWERRPVGEQDALVPTALGLSGPVDQETGYGDISFVCGRRQALGVPETAGVPKHRCVSPGEPTAVDVHGSGRVPVAVWVSGPTSQETNPRNVLDMWERVHAARIPTSSGVPMASGVPPASEDLWSIGEDTGSGAFPGLWGRRQAFKFPVAARVPVASEVPGLVGEEYGSEGVPRSWGRRQTARVPVAAEVPTAPRVPGPPGVETGSGSFSGLLERRQMARVPVAARLFTIGGVPGAPRGPRPVQEETGSRGVSGLWEGRQTAGVPAGAKGSTAMGVPVSARMPGPMGEKTGSGGISGLLRGRQPAGIPMAEGLRPATGVPGTVGVEPCSGGPLGLWGRRQAVRIPLAAGVPGPAAGATSSGEVSGVWGRNQATEVPIVARVPVPVEGETDSEDVSGLWKRQQNGTVPEALRVPQSLGVLAAVGVPVAGRMPAAVWVTESTGEKTNGTVSGLTVVRGQSTEESGPAGEETESRRILGLAGKRQAVGVSHTCGSGTRLWGCPRSVGEAVDYGNVQGVSGTRMTVEVPETVEIPPVAREETGLGHFRDHPPHSGRRQAAGVSEVRVRGNNLGENYVGEDRL